MTHYTVTMASNWGVKSDRKELTLSQNVRSSGEDEHHTTLSSVGKGHDDMVQPAVEHRRRAFFLLKNPSDF